MAFIISDTLIRGILIKYSENDCIESPNYLNVGFVINGYKNDSFIFSLRSALISNLLIYYSKAETVT